jgi:hypothetical protein
MPDQQDIDFWKRLEGQLLEGQFPLDSCQTHNKTTATFLTRLPNHEQPLLLKIVLDGSPDKERFFASWNLARQLQHPNLLRMHAGGLGKLDGLRVAYSITDQPDAYLADVLKERCLTEEEGREVLVSCAQALQYLHEKGLVHAQVEPAAILSRNELIQLSSDHLQQADDGHPVSADILALGVTTLQVLTGKTAPTTVPPTEYSGILRSCLAANPADRPTARRIVSSLQNELQPFNPPKAEVRPVSVAKVAIPAACVLLLAGAWLVSRPARVAAPVVPPVKIVEQQSADRSPEKPSPVPTPAVAPPVTAPVAPRKRDSAAASRNWLVVVYTYAQSETAQHKADEINRKWPDLQAHVLTAKSGSPHLVVLGNGLDREQASQLRQKALDANLPRDTYIQNF